MEADSNITLRDVSTFIFFCPFYAFMSRYNYINELFACKRWFNLCTHQHISLTEHIYKLQQIHSKDKVLKHREIVHESPGTTLYWLRNRHHHHINLYIYRWYVDTFWVINYLSNYLTALLIFCWTFKSFFFFCKI